MQVDIEYVPLKKPRTFVETMLCTYANTYVNDLRNPNNFSDFYSMNTIVSNLKEYQQGLLKGNKKYSNLLKIYSWSNGQLPGDNIIQIQREREETAIAQIKLNSWPQKQRLPAAAPVVKKGPGRPAGSGKRTEQLKVRCSPEVLSKLQQLQDLTVYQGYSQADIIEHLVLNNHAYLSL